MMTICVFDLDGTLWKNNSHVEIVGNYRYGKYYKLLQPMEKIVAHLCPRYYQKYLDSSILKIPVEFVSQYLFNYRQDAINEMKARKALGEKIIVISNAPCIILESSARYLQVECLYAAVGEKKKALIDRIHKWDKLTVVTDNLTDADLLSLADEAIIYTPRRRLAKFKALGLKIPVSYRSINTK